jgi:phosphatidylglycerol:prolipoprotein diacylglycerol transferase
MTLAAWFHTLSPYIYKNDFLPVRWYGVAYALGFMVGWMLLKFLARRRASLIPLERVGDAILIAVVGVVVGGRLGYVIFYEPSLLADFDWSRPPWWGLLAINRGGMASHGGMIGVIIAAFFIARGFRTTTGERLGKAPVLHVLDMMALIAPLGLGLGRIANFINGELLGKIVAMPGQPAPWWAVKFPQEIETEFMPKGHRPVLDPDQTMALHQLVQPYTLPDHSFLDAYGRVLNRIWAGDSALARSLEPLISARHPSQLYQAFTDGVVLFVALWWIAARPRRPGVIGCWFLIVYGAMRIATEFFRLPDAQLENKVIAGLSRGQWLSVGMIVAGVVALPMIMSRAVPKLGGWGRREGSVEGMTARKQA